MSSKVLCAALLVGLGAVSAAGAAARAAVQFEYILDGAYGTDLSADGTFVAGNTAGAYIAFRWSEATGFEELGMSTAIVLGRGAGSPDISADGTRVSGTILSADSTYVTAGIWTAGQGWQQLAPPVPVDGGLVDESLASAWGMSEDGQTVVGLYWRPCGAACGGSAHGIAWTTAGYTDYGDPTQGSSRINDTNSDGTVIVGWEAHHSTGIWQSTVWRGGQRWHLVDGGITGGGELGCVTPDGSIVGGNTAQLVGANWTRPAAYWTWNGSGWDEHVLGMLPFTSPVYGSARVEAMSADGSIMAGTNINGPGDFSGWIWTAETGMLKTEDWLAYHGVSFGDPFLIQQMTAISDNGRVLIGIGINTVQPYIARTFRITIDAEVAAPPLAASRVRLDPAYPNPFNPATTVPLSVSSPTHVSLDVFNISGQRVRSLHEGVLSAGRHEFVWDGRDAGGRQQPSGVYFARAQTSQAQSPSQRLVLIK